MVGNNGVPFINGKLYDWADIVLVIAGVPVTGITGIEYKDDQDIVTKYGAGRYPVGYAKGRITGYGLHGCECVCALLRAALLF